MSEQLPRGLILRRVGYLALQEAINEYYNKGYKMRSIHPNFESYEAEKGSSIWYAFVELDEDYGDVIEVADAPEAEANRLLALKRGWKVASTSVSARFYRMIKRELQNG